MSKRANSATARQIPVGFSLSASRRFLFATVSAAAVMACTQQTHARGFGNSASTAMPAAAVAAAAQNNAQDVARRATQAQQSLQRTTSNMQAMLARQAAAQAAAAQASGIPHGLQPGGLQVAPTAAAGSSLWQGAALPTEFKDGDRSKVTVLQGEQKAILTWRSFNVSEKTDLYFDQRAGAAEVKNWVALNRVLDPSTVPSRILGTIKAEGQVYVINQNGIIFGAGSQVNVGALVASSLALSNEQFLRGINNPMFHADQAANHYGIPTFGEHADGGDYGTLFIPGRAPGHVSVEAGASIKVENGGKLMLFAPKVANAGHLAATDGQIILAAGEQVWLSTDLNGVRGLDVAVSAPGSRLFHHADLAGAVGLGTNYGGFTNFVKDSILPEMEARAAAVGYSVVNTGSIHVDRGNITLQARDVLQSGVLTASSALNNREGSIRLRAWGQGMMAYNSAMDNSQVMSWSSGTLTLGSDSVAAVLPDLTDSSEIEQALLGTRYKSGNVQLRGNLIDIKSFASVMVPSGTISAVAAKLPIGEVYSPSKGPSDIPVASDRTEKDGSRIYIDTNAYMTVAGVQDVLVPMTRNFVQAELYINELRDSPIYRDSWLRGLKVIVDRRVSGTFTSGPMSAVEWIVDKPGQWVGSPLADFSAWIGVGKTDLGELSTKGGSIILKSGGSVITRAGSLLDVSGGSVRYTDGVNTSTRLLGYDGRIYNIGDATPDMIYVGLPGGFTRTHNVQGRIDPRLNEKWSSVFDRGMPGLERGYTEGRDGGSIQVYGGEALILDGGYWGGVITGERQAINGKTAKAGALKIGAGSDPDRGWTPSNLVISDGGNPLLADFNAHSEIPTDYYRPRSVWPSPQKFTWLDAATLSESGLGKLDLFVTSGFWLEQGARLTLDPGATLSVNSNGPVSGDISVNIAGAIRVAGGTVSLGTAGGGLRSINLGAGSSIDVSGEWVNEITDGRGTHVPMVNGGTIDLSPQIMNAGPRAMLDVSGGGWVTRPNGKVKLKTGDAGKIGLTGVSAEAMANLGMRAFAAGSGGVLQIETRSPVQLGGVLPTDPSIFYAPGSLYAEYGFRSVALRAPGEIIVPDGTTISHLPVSVDLIGVDIANVSSGSRISDIGQVRALQPEQRAVRKPAEVSLLTLGAADVIVGTGATLRTDTGGKITIQSGRDALLRGTIDAPAGTIDIATAGKLNLSAGAALLARGVPLIYRDARGYRTGEVKAGGRISLDGANLSLDAGALIDVSGSAGEIDLRRGGFGAGRGSSTLQIASDGGLISIKGNGVIASALVGRPGGTGAAGGRLVIDHSEAPNGSGPTPGEQILSQITWLDPTCFYAPYTCEQNPQNVIGFDVGRIFEDFEGGQMPTMILTRELIELLSFRGRSEFVLSETAMPGKVQGTLDPARFGLTPEALDAFRDKVFSSEFLRTSLASPPSDSVMLVRPSAMAGGGFADINFSSLHAVKLDGATVVAGRSIALEGPVSNFGASSSTLRAPTIRLESLGAVAASTSTTAQLNLQASLIDIVRYGTIRGFAETRFETTDLRLTAPAPQAGQPRATSVLDVEGDLWLKAAQIYPTSGVAATIKTAGRIVVMPNGAAPAPLSAGGSLTLEARVIEQGGTLRAPFGQITLKASDRVTLGAGSITSVSGLGLVVPYGALSNGEHWIDPSIAPDFNDPSKTYLAAPPEKRLVIDAPNVDVGSGSTIDVRGGGDLYTREFVPGPGGSHDILTMPNAYAVLPGYSGIAPSGSSLGAGDSVYLVGGNGLAPGWYTLLPASYAALPGGYLVSFSGSVQSATMSAAMRLNDGSMLMGGTRANALSGTSDRISSMWRVMSGSQLRQYSEYNEAFANSYFSSDAFKLTRYRLTGQEIVTPRLPIDGGAVVFKATQELTLNGQLQSQAAAGGRGGLVDIAGARIAIVGSGQDTSSLRADGYLVIDANQLTSFGAGSLLIGGMRTGDARGLRLDVTASDVTLRNDGNSVLAGPEILLAANGLIDIQAGSVILSRGEASAGAGDLVITPQVKAVYADPDGSDDGDPKDDVLVTPSRDYGALIRLSNADQVRVIRENVDVTTGGEVKVGTGVQIAGGQALLIDATRNTELSGSAALSAKALSLASGRIGFGGGSQGLVLSTQSLAQLANTEHLTLRSYTTIDFHDSVSFGGAGLSTVTLDAGGFVGIGGYHVAVTGKTIALQNSGQTVAATIGLGAGSLTLAAEQLMLGTGTKTFDGFGSVTLAATSQVIGEGKGGVDAGRAALTVATPVLTGRNSATQALVTTGALSIVGDTTAPLADMQGSLGTRLVLTGGSVNVGGRIVALGGAVDLTATSGDIVLSDGSLIDVGGFAKQFFDIASYADAGRIGLTTVSGNIRMSANAAVNLAAHAGGGNAGSLSVLASGGGGVQLDGRMSAQAGATGKGGSFVLDLAALPDFAGLSGRLNTAGFLQSRQFRIRSGDVIVDGLTQVADFSLSADLGKVTLTGTVDARATYGGRITISAGNGVVMENSALLLAGATDQNFGSGRVTLEASSGQLDLRGGTVDVSGGERGRVRLRARQTAAHDEIDVARLDTRIVGARSAVLEGVSIYTDSPFATVKVDAVADANTFASNIAAIAARLGNGDVRLMPGIEIRSTGDLTVDSDWNLFTDFATLREGGLTLRAAGNLIVRGHISDGFDLADRSGVLQDTSSWDLRLVAGADLASASAVVVTPLAGLTAGKGNLVVGDATNGKLIRTGTGDIDIRVGRNLDLAKNKSVIYTAGRNDLTVWPDFTSAPTGATFGIEGGHLNINAQGNITSMVAPPSIDPSNPSNSSEYQVFADWLYRQGDIDVDLLFAANKQTAWWVNYGKFQQGVGALGGGNVTVNAGGDLVNLLVALPTNARVRGGRVVGETKILEMRGGGAMNVTAAGTIAGGQYYVARGAGSILAGELGIGRTTVVTRPGEIQVRYTVSPVLALGDATLAVRTAGEMRVQTVLDPLMIGQLRPLDPDSAGRSRAYMSGHTERTAIELVSVGGNVTLVNDGQAIFGDMDLVWRQVAPADEALYKTILTGENRYASITRIAALNGSIEIGGPLYTMPGANAELRILADKNIHLTDKNPLNVDYYPVGTIRMSRATLAMMPTPFRPYVNGDFNLLIANDQGPTAWFNSVHETYIKSVSNPDRLPMVHDVEPSRMYARTGSITGDRRASVTTNEQTWFRAGNNVRGIQYSLRNIRPSDVSLIEAGNDIVGGVGIYNGSIQIEGPGGLMLTANRDIFGGGTKDGLGNATSISIHSVGNRHWDSNNRPIPLTDIKGLPEEGASITLLVGLNGEQPNYNAFMASYLDPANVAAMPDYLKTALPNGTVVPIYLVDRTTLDKKGKYKLERRGLTSFMEEMTGETLSPLAAWERFRMLPQLTQQSFLRRAYMQELRDAGRNQNEPGENGLPLNGGYNRGYAAIAALFPGTDWKGDIVASNLSLRTMAGGDIEVLTPGGGLQIAALGATVPAGAGLITLGTGHINIFTKDDVTVNRSRILTFVPDISERGSDMIIWSTLGGIDAGRGAKTLRIPSAPDILTDEDAVTRILERSDMSGSGIGTIGDGDLDLVAPLGTVNFGDAGVRVARNFNVAALQVLNVANIKVGDESKGLPPPPKEAPLTMKSENDSKAANDAAKTASQATSSQAPSVIIVEVLGYGGGDGNPSGGGETERQRDEELRRRNQNRRSYDPNAPVQIVGHGALTNEQMGALTPEEQARKRQAE